MNLTLESAEENSVKRPPVLEGECVRCLLVDDHVLVRGGLRAILQAEPGMRVVAEAGSVEEALALLETLEVDLVLLDLVMPGIGGVEGAQRLLEDRPGLRVVVVSHRVDPSDVRKLVLAGVAGFVSKLSPADELLRVIRSAASGQMTLCPAYAGVLGHLMRPSDGAGELTARQLEVLILMEKGLTTRDIAERLFLSPRTVEKHRRDVLRALDARNTPHALRIARRKGLIR